ncbi:hypothetical protein ISS30_01710 [bacterium]|nr:hypothetical protein [FCB group bacterium]MBL7190382.1 hypothetical protein [bacterium]
MDIFNYFKDIYDTELKRWDDSLKSLYYPTTILIVIIGAVSSYSEITDTILMIFLRFAFLFL